jgi:endonuclease III
MAPATAGDQGEKQHGDLLMHGKTQCMPDGNYCPNIPRIAAQDCCRHKAFYAIFAF